MHVFTCIFGIKPDAPNFSYKLKLGASTATWVGDVIGKILKARDIKIVFPESISGV